MNKLSNIIKSFAVRSWQKYSFKKEWASVIVLLLILKLATSAVSVFSGWFYLDNFFYSFTDSEIASRIFAGVALTLIEGLCALFLAKFFKFALRLEFLTAALPLICAALVFAVSFIVSTNGIALYANKAEDLSKEINDKYNLQVADAKKQCNEECELLTRHIETEKANPQGWSGGKRTCLSQWQAEEIAKTFDIINGNKRALSATLQDIEKQRNLELAENNRATIDTADKYYKIVAFIMLVQVVCSGGLWFFWCKIAGQDAPENDKREAIEEIYTKTVGMVDSGIDNCITAKLSEMQTVFAQLNNDHRVKELLAKHAAPTPTATKKRAGFAVPETPENAPENAEILTPDNANTVAVSAVKSVNATPRNGVNQGVNGNATCAECGNPLTPSQVIRHARFCCPACRVKNYNKRNPERKPIVIANTSLKD